MYVCNECGAMGSNSNGLYCGHCGTENVREIKVNYDANYVEELIKENAELKRRVNWLENKLTMIIERMR